MKKLRKILRKIKSFVTKADYFNSDVNFYVQGEPSYNTLFGGIISLLLYILLTLLSLRFFIEFVKKVNPTVIQSTEILNNPGNISYPNDFLFLFSLELGDTPTINENIFYPSGKLYTIENPSESPILYDINIDKCKNVFSKNFKYYNLVSDKKFDNYYCISSDELYMNNSWGEAKFKMLQIYINECNSTDENSKCLDKKEIDEQLKSAIVSLYSLKNFVNISNYNDPFTPGLDESFYYVTNKNHLAVTQYLKHIQVDTDDGLIWSNSKKNNSITIDSTIYFSEEIVNEKRFFTISFQIKNILEKYNRQYYRLIDLLSDIGGICEMVMFLGSFLLNKYSESNLYIQLMEKFFFIKKNYTPQKMDKYIIANINNKMPININNERLNTENENIINSSEKISEREDRETELNENIRKWKKEKKNVINLNFNWFDQFIGLCLLKCFFKSKCLLKKKCVKNSIYNYYYTGKKYISDILEINNYLKYSNAIKIQFNIDKKAKESFDYIYAPILTGEYAGSRFIDGNTELN